MRQFETNVQCWLMTSFIFPLIVCDKKNNLKNLLFH